MCVLIFSTTVSETTHSRNNAEKYHLCTRLFLLDFLIKLEFSRHVIEKHTIIKIS
jgi:hypothetical protein